MRRFLGLCVVMAGATALLQGCQTTSMDGMIWVRTDGQIGSQNPALQREFEIHRTVCVGETQKSAVGAPVIYYQGLVGAIDAAMYQNAQAAALLDIMKGCMASKGYVLVPQSEAPAIAESFRKKK